MLFRMRYIVRHFGLSDTPKLLEVEKHDVPPVRLELRLISEKEIKQSYEKDDWVALLYTEEDVSEKTAAEFERNDGGPAQAVRDISGKAGTRMSAFLRDFLRVVRWRTSVYGHHQLIRCAEEGLQWSHDGKDWKQSRGWLLIASLGGELRATPYKPQLFEQVSTMVVSGDHEPVGHELLREAWNLRSHSPRSALMLGVSALEVGVKAFVVKLVPASEWICFELPAPPVVRMLEEYLHSLPVKLTINGKVFIPPRIIQTLKKAVFERNRVAHKGATVDDREELAEILTTIQMALYFLDYYAGYSWALNNMRHADIYDLLQRELSKR